MGLYRLRKNITVRSFVTRARLQPGRKGFENDGVLTPEGHPFRRLLPPFDSSNTAEGSILKKAILR
jgi:hypothetical protein